MATDYLDGLALFYITMGWYPWVIVADKINPEYPWLGHTPGSRACNIFYVITLGAALWILTLRHGG